MLGLGCAISLLSATALALEILLMRLLAIIQWHHFAYMIVSVALLGFGASGTLLALAQRWFVPRFVLLFAVNGCIFGFAVVGCFSLAQRVPLNPLALVWDLGQFPHLAALYLLLMVPFFCAANAIGLTYRVVRGEIPRLYRFDLVGGGMGALAVITALHWLTPVACLKGVALAGFVSASLVLRSHATRRVRHLAPCAALAGALCLWAWPETWLTLRVSDYKGLSQTLRLQGAHVVAEHSSPLGLLTVVRSPTIPFRHAPGLSLRATEPPPEQLGVFTDGDGLSVITRADGDSASLAYLDDLPWALPYQLQRHPQVLILGAGCGQDVLMAVRNNAASIDAVEINPRVVELVTRDYADFAGHIAQQSGVRFHVSEARGFVARSPNRYDLIQIALLDSFGAACAGVHALSETYLYTVEAFQDYLRLLKPAGILAVTRWLAIPPRDTLKLLATAVRALEADHGGPAKDRMVLLRSWQTTTLLVKNGPFVPWEIDRLQTWSAERFFDLDYCPGSPNGGAGRFNLLGEPYLSQGALALLGNERTDFLERYKFSLVPATDDRPFFFHFLRWGTLRELWSLRGQGGAALIEWSYLILLATLLQAAMASSVIVLLPLWAASRPRPPPRDGRRLLCYFLCLGLAFLSLEMAFMQKAVLFLSHPLHAAAVVLCGFLVCAGLGSGMAGRWLKRDPPREERDVRRALRGTVLAIPLLVFASACGLSLAAAHLMDLPHALKAAVALCIMAPLAFLLGMPYPLGLSLLAAAAPRLIPWAWAVNGCASVVGGVTATVLAMHWGFHAVMAGAAALYGIAWFAWRKPLAGVSASTLG
jgi:spermidine synthase